MGKYKYLLKNMGILTIGQFSTKILVFLLVPLYTNFLSVEAYGEYDVVSVTVSLIVPIFTANISVATQRFAMDQDAKINNIVRISLKYFIFGIGLSLVFLILNHILNISMTIKNYEISFLFLFIITVINSIMVALAVGLGEIKKVAIAGVIGSFVTIMLNIIFLVFLNLGLYGYFAAYILGPLTQTTYLFGALKIYNWLKKESVIDDVKIIEKEMLAYSVPQIVNNISWWINNASDRYIVTFFCGVATNGIYSVAYKIPSIINIFVGIFGQAWGVSAVKNFSEDDKEGFFSKTYAVYSFTLVSICSFIILITKILARILFAKDFYYAWRYVPFLLISTILGAMAGHFGGIFAAKKEPKDFARSTMIGAISNIIMNIFLVPKMGAMGAAVATMMSYFIVWLLRYIHSRKYISMQINMIKEITGYCILTMQAIVINIVENAFYMYLIQCVLIGIIFIMNLKEMKMFLALLKKQR